jgi:hypothetical protein
MNLAVVRVFARGIESKGKMVAATVSTHARRDTEIRTLPGSGASPDYKSSAAPHNPVSRALLATGRINLSRCWSSNIGLRTARPAGTKGLLSLCRNRSRPATHGLTAHLNPPYYLTLVVALLQRFQRAQAPTLQSCKDRVSHREGCPYHRGDFWLVMVTLYYASVNRESVSS